MKKNRTCKLFTISLIITFILGLYFGDISSFKANANNSKRDQKTSTKSINRIKKYFGKKDSTGQDYTLESTTGVGAVTDKGLDESDINAADNAKNQIIKDNLYNNSTDVIIKTIEDVIKPVK